jgi:hypothetical protein
VVPAALEHLREEALDAAARAGDGRVEEDQPGFLGRCGGRNVNLLQRGRLCAGSRREEVIPGRPFCLTSVRSGLTKNAVQLLSFRPV